MSKYSPAGSRSQSPSRYRSPPHSVPFPSGSPNPRVTLSPSRSDVLDLPANPDSLPTEDSGIIHTTTNSRSFNSNSSKRTDSDKLSALPPSLPASPRNNRYPAVNSSRSIRRSLDGSSLALHESPPPSSPPIPPTNFFRTNASEPSLGKESPRQRRISFDSDHSVGTLRSIRQMAGRITGLSDKQQGGSPPIGMTSLPASHRRPRSDSRSSRTHSRAGSPLRLFQWSLHRTHSREEPFIAVDPFKWHFFCPPHEHAGDPDNLYEAHISCFDCVLPFACCLPAPVTASSSPKAQGNDLFANSRAFISDTLPRQMYLNFLLRLPALYFSRIARIFEDAEVSKGDMQRMIDASYRKPVVPNAPRARTAGATAPSNTNQLDLTLPWPEDWAPPTVSPALARFKNSWEEFIDSLMREWKTLNLVSGLLCSAILTMFQVPEMAYDPVTRTAALVSLVCALMSLSYGCIFIVRFGTMRSMHRASRWAEEAQKTKTSIIWNVWVLLATPAVWIAWSMIAFIISILSYVWRSGSTNDPTGGEWPRLTPTQSLGPRLLVTAIVALGLVYFALIVKTFTKYGKSGVTENISRGRERLRRPPLRHTGTDVGLGLGLGLGVGAGIAIPVGSNESRGSDVEKGDVAVDVEAVRSKL